MPQRNTQNQHQTQNHFTPTLNSSNPSSRRFSLLADPSPQPTGKFLVVSNSELRSYQSWKSDQQQTHYRSISFRSDLPYSYKCVDWSTTRQGFDLVATGTLTGRAFLVTLPYAHHPPSKPELYSPHPIISFSTAKSNRPCNSIAFSPCGKLLALALDKARDYGLQIFDVDRILGLSQSIATHEIHPSIKSTAPLSGLINQKTRELVLSPHPNSSTEPHSDQLLSAQALNAEAVHALEYMLVTSGSAQPALLTASSSKLIGLYDLRSPGTKLSNGDQLPALNNDYTIGVLNPVSQWPVRSILGIKADPLVAHRFATWSDDRSVKLWDTRKTSECVLQFSEDDSHLLTRTKPESSAKGNCSNQIVSVTWSKTRKGVLATLSSESSQVRVWDIVDGNPPVQNSRNWGDGSLLNPFGTRNNLPPTAGSSAPPASFPNAATNFRKSTIAPRGSSPSTSPREKLQIPNYTLFSSRLLKPFSRPSQSIVAAHMPSIGVNTPSDPQEYCCNYLSISRDGHLEFVESKFSGEACFGSRGQTAYSDGVRLRIEWHPVDEISRLPVPHNSSVPMSAQTSNTITGSIQSPQVLDAGAPQVPLDLKACSFQDVTELRLANKFGRHLVGIPHPFANQSIALATEVDSGPLKNDISMIMMKRALSGYGPDSLKNEHLVTGDPVLGAFWEWITHSDKLSQQGTGLVNGYDFGFQGVLAIMKGFLPADEQQLFGSLQSNLATPLNIKSPPQGRATQTPPEMFGDFSKMSKQKSASGHNKTSYGKQMSQYLKALRTFNHSHQVENFTISSDFSDQRQTALFLCGPDYNSGKIEEVVSKYEQLGMYGKACAIALFSGNTQRAITSLQRSDDLQLRTLAPTLATHLNTQRLGQPRDALFDKVCRQLSDERTSEPYLRAIFAYCSTGDWHEVIDETGLPLKDRLAVGLRFLSDEEIFQWLEASARDAIQSGDLEGILLTGLNYAAVLKNRKSEEGEQEPRASSRGRSAEEGDEHGGGFRLIQTYVNRTGDLQTAALASHLILPTRLRHPSAERWVDSYRRLLDRWAMFKVRVELDISRGQRARQMASMMSSTSVGGGGSGGAPTFLAPNNVAKKASALAPHDLAPPQLMLRCQHCQEVVSDAPNVIAQIAKIVERNPPLLSASSFSSPGFPPPNGLTGSGTSAKKNPGPNGLSVQSRQTNRCRLCGKGLPKCSICLVPLTINDSRSASVWAWCHRCRHVGHANHLSTWFTRGNRICPVAGCDCLCWDPPPPLPPPSSSSK
ncbi:hypothetical protein PCASD_18182 [Puccinia coronata f. sp. avenae]|uniref:MIOS-like alpha-solenoid domain-containing protein n=1 Tax=Puccinia coronata f. sp. avenae TaxID=200324 RepID=A0A2N5TST7_9BASI|nr:hypothetical protein PCASD_18182 [Puccinia coronata f. sp. avenae]